MLSIPFFLPFIPEKGYFNAFMKIKHFFILLVISKKLAYGFWKN